MREKWSEYYRNAKGSKSTQPQESVDQQGSTPNRNGGHRGPLTSKHRLNRAETLIAGIDLAGNDAQLQDQICELIDQLRESIEADSASVSVDMDTG